MSTGSNARQRALEIATSRTPRVFNAPNSTTATNGSSGSSGANVKATVNEHLKWDKVIVFKKKRRKGYRVKNGHRDFLTSITIDAING